jgi:hypothetical protein
MTFFLALLLLLLVSFFQLKTLTGFLFLRV